MRSNLARRSVRVSCAAIFAPLSHGQSRRTVWSELLHGGRIGLCDTRMDLLEQIQTIAPTALQAAPRFYSLYERRFEAELAKCADRDAALRAVRLLGGERLRLVAVGGAMVPPSQLAFLRDCFGNGGIGGGQAVVSNGYGMAEVPGGIARDGVPLPGVEIKLQPLSQNADEPRREEGIGEILVKTARGVIVGSGGSKAILDGEGWFHTGDLGRWVDDDNNGQKRLEVIERLGFTVKLANGEFLTPQMLRASTSSAARHA